MLERKMTRLRRLERKAADELASHVKQCPDCTKAARTGQGQLHCAAGWLLVKDVRAARRAVLDYRTELAAESALQIPLFYLPGR